MSCCKFFFYKLSWRSIIIVHISGILNKSIIVDQIFKIIYRLKKILPSVNFTFSRLSRCAEIDKLYPCFSTSFFAAVPFPTPENPDSTSNEPLFSMIFPFLSYSMFSESVLLLSQHLSSVQLHDLQRSTSLDFDKIVFLLCSSPVP